MKHTNFGWHFLIGVLLTGTTVVADDVKLATGKRMAAALVQRTSSSLASATEAVSAPTVVAATASPARSGDGPLPLLSSTNTLPPLLPGVTELKFSEFFRSPIGPRGLELTDKLRSLDGRRIRILGYMVQQARPTEHCFLFANRSIAVNEAEYGLCDDLPANTLRVITTADAPAATPFTPGLLLLTGTLSISNRVETDGRVSAVRLYLNPPTAEQRQAAVQAAEAFVRQPDPHAGHQH
ncbi:MAG: hypothetical protein QM813_19170 [Verrucomicrobiota bacterium]